MERETLSNNTEYQERLREARIKGPLGDQARGKTLEETLVIVYHENRQLQQQVSNTISNIMSVDQIHAVSDLFQFIIATGD